MLCREKGELVVLTVIQGIPVEKIIKQSRFISVAYHVRTHDEALSRLTSVQNQWPKATHYVWAYILDPGHERMTDDKEPQGTAGAPTLALLQKHHLIHTMLITVRYFGGTKLGTGGLVHAYQDAAKEALAQAKLGQEQEGIEIHLLVPYSQWEPLKKFMADNALNVSVDFSQTVGVHCALSETLWDQIHDTILYKIAPNSQVLATHRVPLVVPYP
ncbi:MAG: YigZ family protein [Sulfobacillus thermosulfidooxidans]|nr:MAG: YigZ family protein [Sulfobacillus thermosulfidooxidans]